MTGKTIREKIRAKNISLSKVAERMGIPPQNLQIKLRAKSISTETLESVAAAIGEPVSYFYNELPIFSIEDYAKVASLNREIVLLKQLLKEKERTIYILQNTELHANLDKMR